MASTEKRKSRGRPFEKGQVANPKGRPKGSKNVPKELTIGKAISAVELSREGYAATRIAKMLNAKPEAVKDALAESLRLMQLYAPEFAAHWLRASEIAAEDGDHKPAMAALQSIEVVKPIAQTYDTNGKGANAVAAVQVQFHGFKLPGLPQPEAVTVDVTARSTP